MSHPTVFFYPRPRVDVAEVPAASHAGAVLLTRLVSEGPSDRASRGRPRSASAAPRILLRESAFEHRPFRR